MDKVLRVKAKFDKPKGRLPFEAFDILKAFARAALEAAGLGKNEAEFYLTEIREGSAQVAIEIQTEKDEELEEGVEKVFQVIDDPLGHEEELEVLRRLRCSERAFDEVDAVSFAMDGRGARYTRETLREIKAILKKHQTESIILVGRLDALDREKRTCFVSTYTYGKVKCKFPKKLTEKLYELFHQLRRDVKLLGKADFDSEGNLKLFTVRDVASADDPFAFREHLRPLTKEEIERVSGALKDYTDQWDKAMEEAREVLWGYGDE